MTRPGYAGQSTPAQPVVWCPQRGDRGRVDVRADDDLAEERRVQERVEEGPDARVRAGKVVAPVDAVRARVRALHKKQGVPAALHAPVGM